MDEVVQQVGDRVVFVDVQLGSSDYGSESGDEVSNQVVKQSYVPAFWMIDRVVDNGSVYPATNAVSYATNAYNDLADEGVTAHISFSYEITGNILTVNTLTKFFKQASGNYYVNVMLLESDFSVNQNGAGIIDAQRVLRVLFSGENGEGDAEFWGTQVGGSTIPAGTEEASTFSTTLESSWNKDNFTIVATIWYRSGNTIKAISVEDVPGDVTPVIKETGRVSEQNRIIGNSNGYAVVHFCSLREESIHLCIYDMAGKLVARSSDTRLESGQSTVFIKTPRLAAGVYYYRLVTQEKIITEKVVIHSME